MLRSHQRYSEASSNRVRIRRGVRESMLRSPCRSLWLRRKWRLLVHGENSKHASIEAEVKKYEHSWLLCITVLHFAAFLAIMRGILRRSWMVVKANLEETERNSKDY
ncbi:uncharacterized protein LOC109833007 [Asparagus officinalis]|uniref:uncharacterized protein LOC109833007 n=1 Tax=Asparagus officinalis TaxID=4686 RepID=UPI00098DFD3E|nr:uncharacterized protein LOC109833007 [Asparagus officinalis]